MDYFQSCNEQDSTYVTFQMRSISVAWIQKFPLWLSKLKAQHSVHEDVSLIPDFALMD